MVRPAAARVAIRRGSTSREGLSLKQSEFYQRRIDRAHRHYLATPKSPAAVRKLALPAIQVNIATNQVNSV